MRPVRLPEPYRRPAVVGLVALVAVGLVGLTLAWQPKTPAAAEASPTPSTTDASPSTTTPPTTDWVPVAELAALDGEGSIVSEQSGFRLTSLDGTPAADLAARLTVRPALDLTVEPESESVVRLLPAEPLAPGTIYRFDLQAPTGQLLDSWAFQARQAVRVIGTLPGHMTTGVPIDTGIEITFDQDGVRNAADHVSIEPAVRGSFEQRGRVLVFIPTALSAGTLYTVTVRKGVTVDGIGEPMADDFHFQFETAREGAAPTGSITFRRDLIESASSSAPAFQVWTDHDADSGPEPRTRFDVFRLAGIDAAIDAYTTIRSAPRWATWTPDGAVDVSALPRVVSFEERVRGVEGSGWIRLPNPLPVGWYLVEQRGATRPIQAVLQVTDVSAYLAVSETTLLVWAHDLATGRPLAGATVTAARADLGRTSAEGLAEVETPQAFVDAASCEACHPVVVVRAADGREVFLPGGALSGGMDPMWRWNEANPDYWLVLRTDRTIFRQTDTINVWGTIRDRATGTVPANISVALRDGAWYEALRQPPIARADVRPGPTGTFTASLPIAELPIGGYTVEVAVGDEVLRDRWIRVEPISKPAYEIVVETGRKVYVQGDRIRTTAHARFFEGTPVAGVPLRLDVFGEADVTTDAAGSATHRTTVRLDNDFAGGYFHSLPVRSARAEEGEITGSTPVFVLPARRTLDVEGRVAGGRVHVTGTVNVVDVDRLERELGAGGDAWSLDPRGAGVSGARVTATITELIPRRTLAGQEYDFVEKRVVPRYVHEIDERVVGTVSATSGRDGRYELSTSAPSAEHEYEIRVTVADEDGLTATVITRTSASGVSSFDLDWPTLAWAGTNALRVGEQIDVTMHHPSVPTGSGPYLFLLMKDGIRETTVQSSPHYVAPFPAWAVPEVAIGAVRFTGAGYVTSGTWASLRLDDRRLDIELSVPSGDRRPRDEVTVSVTTRNAAGRPVPASVVLRAIDEKLFAIGGVDELPVLEDLYAGVPAGILSGYQSHAPAPEGERDTTGGGGDERSDFRDSLLFRLVETGADGTGSATFRLSDDLTSWRVMASAISIDLEAGDASVAIPVRLPFFVDVALAHEYLASDRPVIQVRTFGTALEAGAAVNVTVESESLGFSSGPIAGRAFEPVPVPLPALSTGIHELRLIASTGSGANRHEDRLVRSFRVVESRLTQVRTSYVDLGARGTTESGEGMTTVVVADAGAGRSMSLLSGLAAGGGLRLDRAVAADLARKLLRERTGVDPVAGSPDLLVAPYQTRDGGLALLPYGSSDLELSALVAIAAPSVAEPNRLESYLLTIRSAPDETRERQSIALAGLAGLRRPVLAQVQAAVRSAELTVRERLMLGLGAAALGDAATARSVAAAIAAEHAEGVGGQLRLRVGSDAIDVAAATALMAVLAAAVGDPNAPAYWDFVDANQSRDELYALQGAAFALRSLERTPARTASFAYTIDGVRTVKELAAGEALQLVLTPSQARSLSLERLGGDIGVTTTWREPVAASAFEPDPDVTVRRTVTPSGVITGGSLVRVDLEVTFGAQAPRVCHPVTDLLPSGLIPVGSLSAWPDPDSGVTPPGTQVPDSIAGQEVRFCAARPAEGGTTARLRYHARVVTPGTYTWEPAVVQSQTGPNRAAVTPLSSVEVK